MEPLHYSFYDSPIGRLTVGVSERGLVHIDLRGTVPQNNAHPRWKESGQHKALYLAELREYSAGKRRTFTVPLDQRGTQFQLRCWPALSNTPYGQTLSYGDFARAVRSPKASRAVGAANHDTPAPTIVPFHRVIASDG